jgi:hypothetical protein
LQTEENFILIGAIPAGLGVHRETVSTHSQQPRLVPKPRPLGLESSQQRPIYPGSLVDGHDTLARDRRANVKEHTSCHS